MNNQRSKRQPRRGILLLLVLSMLAFLSILVVTYVAFSSRSRRNAYALASREFRSIKHDEIIDDALLTLLRGPRSTSSGGFNTANPFFGEDLLADIYGVSDHTTTSAIGTGTMLDSDDATTDQRRPMYLGGQFVRIPLDATSLTSGNAIYHLDDALAGRILTMQQGPLANQSFRVLRSTGNRDKSAVSSQLEYFEYLTKHSVVIELDPNAMVALGSGERERLGNVMSSSQPFAVSTLFYWPGTNGVWGAPGDDDSANGPNDYSEAGFPGTDDSPYGILINGTVMNGGGAGYEGTGGISGETSQPLPLPFAFQPNVRNAPGEDKSDHTGDTDEPYDAADFQNWFLAHRYVDENGVIRVTPSFHRPALINYLVNHFDLSSVSPAELRALVSALRRATMRPLPFAVDTNDIDPNTPPMEQMLSDGSRAANTMTPHHRFTGGNSEFALRSPNLIVNPGSTGQMQRLHALVNALVNGPWDVDNDGDSIPDSVWVDLGLPPVSSPEGKILQPLIAPLIEDMGGRLHLNAHGNLAQLEPQYTTNQSGPWGGTTTNGPAAVFRGLGYGPAEIVLPGRGFITTSGGGDVNIDARLFTTTERLALLRERYRDPADLSTSFPSTPAPGRTGGDDLDILLHGARPGTHSLGGGWGMSIDPWGRGGLGVHRTGQLFASVSGTRVKAQDPSATPPQPLLDESFNDPYELDPTGRLGGDSPYTLADLEVLVRDNPWAADELPARLRNLVTNSRNDHPEIANMVTTRSVSLDLPTAMMTVDDRDNRSVPLAEVLWKRLAEADILGNPVPANPTAAEYAAANALYQALIAPELRLGNKMDINRPFGNGVDDRGTNGVDDDNDGNIDNTDERNGVIDEPTESIAESNAFPGSATTSSHVASAFGGQTPNYHADQPSDPNDPGGRQLFARNLYILMMALTGDGYDFPLESNTGGGGNAVDPDDYKKRRLAQWAVNVVDYRDHDSIMTAFEYDTDLSDGTWDVDGNLETVEPTRDVVWGVENPELVFSETAAFHDVRVRDTKHDPGGKQKVDEDDGVQDTDSVRMPQGSLFMELYCPRARFDQDARHLAGVPQELYQRDSGQHQLDLARLAPPDTNNVRMPVWRIAISEPHYVGVASGKDALDPETMRSIAPDTTSFDPLHPDELEPKPNPVTDPDKVLFLNRFVFFNELGNGGAPTAPTVANTDPDVREDHQVFHNILGAPDTLLEPSQYLTLAPRATTHLGSRVYTSVDEPTGPSRQRFEVNSTTAPVVGLAHFDHQGTRRTRNTTAASRPGLSLTIATDPPDGWGASELENGYVGLNVSEPLPRRLAGYYPKPTEKIDSTNAAFSLTDAYFDYAQPPNRHAIDQPVDMSVDGPIKKLTDDRFGTDEPYLGTQQQYCSAFLQRLADPTRPFHWQTNPYRTVDWMSIDLTVFSGEEDPKGPSPPIQEDLYSDQSRERSGETRIGQPGALFSYQTDFPAPNANVIVHSGDPATPYFNFDADPTTPDPMPNSPPFEYFKNSFNHLNAGFGTPIVGAGNEDRGQPQTPFAMHHWLNRPFATVYELMMVPATSQGRLFEEFTLADTSESPYEPADFKAFRAPFGHLLNFFQTSEAEDESAHFYRLFEFVGTKPPFKGEVALINPSRVARPTTLPPANLRDASRDAFVDIFQPPFNQRWDGRREGAINLNTLAGYPVWMGLMYGHLTIAERDSPPDGFIGDLNYGTFMTARRGYPLVPGSPIVTGNSVNGPPYNYDNTRFNPGSPTEYAGAWRTGLDADLAPDVHGANGAAPTDALQRPGIEATLSRPDIDPSDLSEQEHPAFVRPATGQAWKDTERSAAMRYQTLMRMPNLTTNQSHIFVVRLTVGYFELDPLNGLGREYKADLGQHERFKATFIIDRSIPVGYQPGSDTNVRNTILFSRIEE